MGKKKYAGALLATLATSMIGLQGMSAPPQQTVTLQQGIGPAVVPHATVFGNTPANTPVTVSIILKTQNTAALQQFIQNSTTPGNPQFHQFMSTAQFAQQFGQPQSVIQAIVNYFQSFGITAYVYPNNLDITLNGTAGEFDQAFSVNLENMGLQGQNFHGVPGPPKVPANVGSPILAVLGLTNYSPFVSNAVRVPQSVLSKLPNRGSSSNTPPTGVVTPQQMEKLYNITPLQSQGDEGQGETIGIVTLASVYPDDPYKFWQGYGISVKPNRINYINVDGGSGAPSEAAGSSETALDIEQSGAIAPQANIDVYEAPNTDYGFVDAFFNAISSNQVDSLSASWGESETIINYLIQQGEESPGYAQSFNEAFMEAAAQGISTFIAAGDQGAYDAINDTGYGTTTNLAVDNPADSPYVTAAGGTTLPWSDIPNNFGSSLGIPDSVVTTQRAWGWDYLWPYYSIFGASSEASFAPNFIAGGGGGYSVIFSQPWYQNGVPGVSQYHAVPYLTPIDQDTSWSFNPNPSVISGRSNGGRAMPDIAMNADPFTGYNIYSTTFGAGQEWGSGWGGTSFVAPQLNGIASLIDAKVGGRVGFWNPQVYQFAQQPNSPFTPMNATGTSNDNLYYTGTAGTVWNPATGLGYPNVADLAQSFAAESEGPAATGPAAPTPPPGPGAPNGPAGP
ncbi:S53 family peptidase [Alicyclobacillus tolerans]|uniref:S53 family peptidase n=1 Tax=Alicyclobacillus tolerans TaxID=90970 RepID=UPI003B7A07F1